MLNQAEFNASVKNIGLRDTLYFARQLGVVMAQAQLWVRQLNKEEEVKNVK